MRELRRMDKPVKRVMIGGGGNIGRKLARNARAPLRGEDDRDARASAPEAIAEELLNSIVLVGDCTDEELLREENIDEMDVYCALTNDDENNILSSMLAKRMGCPR